MLLRVIEQHFSRDITDQTQAEGEKRDENQIEFEQFHS
jgi:hypothetical protein